MIKFIYPISSEISQKKTAWMKLHDICATYNFSTSRPRLREETFDSNIIFHHFGGEPMIERRKVFTFTFYVEREAANKLIDRLCNRKQKLARMLTLNTVLLCIDDELAVRPI